jgi:hypothetical protein
MVEQLSSSHHLLADAIISLTLARLVLFMCFFLLHCRGFLLYELIIYSHCMNFMLILI